MSTAPSPALDPKTRARVLTALVALYLVWGGTFMAMRVGLEAGWPPLG